MDRRVQNQTNLRKSNETVPNQTELFENRRRCPIPGGTFRYQTEASEIGCEMKCGKCLKPDGKR